MTEETVLITAEDITALYTACTDAGIQIWIDGGWCVDALLGKQTRPHKDLDIAIDQKDVNALFALLWKEGYQEIRKEEEYNMVRGNTAGHEIDIHVFVSDAQGNIIGGTAYPTESLTGIGSIDGHEIRCISAEYMIQFIAPWFSKHPEKYGQDISALCEKFGIAFPAVYEQYTSLSPYHQKYAKQSAEEIQNKVHAKKEELEAIFREVTLDTKDIPVRLAVLGCGDKRFVTQHQKIFEEVLHKKVSVTTFDITIQHLKGEEHIFQHDCTLPLPHGPYAITYGHVLLKFIAPQKQFDVLRNSYEALTPWGIAIHVLDTEEITTTNDTLPDWSWSVPLEKHIQELTALNISYKKIPVKYGVALVLVK